jgi:hypothetical protein
VYQGVASRNGTTTREILAHRTGDRPNFALTEFSQVRRTPFLGASVNKRLMHLATRLQA